MAGCHVTACGLLRGSGAAVRVHDRKVVRRHQDGHPPCVRARQPMDWPVAGVLSPSRSRWIESPTAPGPPSNNDVVHPAVRVHDRKVVRRRARRAPTCVRARQPMDWPVAGALSPSRSRWIESPTAPGPPSNNDVVHPAVIRQSVDERPETVGTRARPMRDGRGARTPIRAVHLTELAGGGGCATVSGESGRRRSAGRLTLRQRRGESLRAGARARAAGHAPAPAGQGSTLRTPATRSKSRS